MAYIAHDDDHAVYMAEIEAIERFAPVMNDTPGFCIVMDQVGGRKLFRRLSWEEGVERNRKSPPPDQAAPR